MSDYTLYRRHATGCTKSGIHDLKCNCPIWVYKYEDGKPIRKSLNTRNWRTATNRLAEINTNPNYTPGYTLHKGVHDFLEAARGRKLAESTVYDYGFTLGKFLKFAEANRIVNPKHIKLPHMEMWLRQHGGKPNSQRKEVVHLRTFFNYLKAHGQIQESPIRKEVFRMPESDDSVTLPYSQEEIKRLLGACKNAKSRAMILVLLNTGLRISDAVQLKRGTVQEDGRLLLRVEKTGVPLFVKLGPDVQAALAAVPEKATSPYYFWSAKSKLRSVCHAWGAVLGALGKRAKVPDCRPHRFRDTFAIELLRSGVSIYVVQKLLGHASVTTTERHYAPWIAEMQQHLDDAVLKLSEIYKAS